MSSNGKKAWITGATGGIGEAIVRALCQQGVLVWAVGRNESKLQSLVQEFGGQVHPVVMDLANPHDWHHQVESLIQQEGGFDILVNNAGVTRDGLALRMKEEDWNYILTVDLTVPFKLAQMMLRDMLKKRWGRVINIGSVVGTTGNGGQCNYVAAKAGLVGWSKSMAQEVASRNVTVNVIAPGYIDTAMTQGLSESIKSQMVDHIPMKRVGHPQEIAAAVAFLAGDGASYITGQTLHINGGMLMV